MSPRDRAAVLRHPAAQPHKNGVKWRWLYELDGGAETRPTGLRTARVMKIALLSEPEALRGHFFLNEIRNF